MPHKFTFKSHCQSFGALSQTVSCENFPALLHSKWISPKACKAVSANNCTCSGWETSLGMAITSIPLSVNCWAACSSASILMSLNTKRMPWLAASCAKANPSGSVAPVITATLSFRDLKIFRPGSIMRHIDRTVDSNFLVHILRLVCLGYIFLDIYPC